MTHDGSKYRLTRTFRPAPGVTEPEYDGDYVQSYFLERDGMPLGEHAAKLELERILPEQISRFFLFDGELLQEYETCSSPRATWALRSATRSSGSSVCPSSLTRATA
jgi:hypothetical protein